MTNIEQNDYNYLSVKKISTKSSKLPRNVLFPPFDGT